ncbi:restriction endonuclease subunit S [Acidithiobacillus sulfuriphilus]|nr:restriction endonuclease subunit S [Acidithiobacillus sulfuriphilus]
MSTVRPNLKAFAYCDLPEGNFAASTGFAVLRATNGTDSRFVLYSILSDNVAQQIERYSVGSNYPAINSSDIRRLEVPDFEPPVQNRIAEILSTLDEAIEQTEALIAKHQQIKAGLMHDLFTRGVTPDAHLRPTREQAPDLYKESPLGWIPKEWEVKRLVDLIAFPSGQVDPRQSQFSEWTLVAPDHIEKETGRLLGIQTAREQGAISGKYTFQPGDIVYSKIRPYLRKAILADFTGLCSADMYPLRPVSGVNPRYLLGVVLGDHFSKFAESVSMRSGFPKINRDEMSGYRCAVPPSLEQEIIAGILLTQDALMTTTQEDIEKLRQQKHGLMHDLLTGRVRVPVAETEKGGTS